jgi:hypothetical protein
MKLIGGYILSPPPPPPFPLSVLSVLILLPPLFMLQLIPSRLASPPFTLLIVGCLLLLLLSLFFFVPTQPPSPSLCAGAQAGHTHANPHSDSHRLSRPRQNPSMPEFFCFAGFGFASSTFSQHISFLVLTHNSLFQPQCLLLARLLFY